MRIRVGEPVSSITFAVMPCHPLHLTTWRHARAEPRKLHPAARKSLEIPAFLESPHYDRHIPTGTVVP